MLQQATKIFNTAFHNSFIKRLSLYLHDCVREEVKSSTFQNLKQDKDNKWMFIEGKEKFLTSYPQDLKIEGTNSLATELMIQSEACQKDKFLIYGFLFLTGKAHKRKSEKEFLTPILYVPCLLQREGKKINCTLIDENLSLNTGAIAALLKSGNNENSSFDDEDDDETVQQMLCGLIDVVPDLPITKDKLEIFLMTLKSLVPQIDIVDVDIEASEKEEEYSDRKRNGLKLTKKSAIILTKRPSITAGVLHELTKISETPSGILRETSLNVINEEYLENNGKMKISTCKKEDKNGVLVPIVPLSLSDSQFRVIESIENNTLVSVFGPPGTGKSQTIVNLCTHLIANGKTVLIASRMDKALDVISVRLNNLGAPFLALRAGRLNYQKNLKYMLDDLLSNKIDLDCDFEDCILCENQDMSELLDKIANVEKTCEKIIELEEKWTKVKSEQNELLSQQQQCEIEYKLVKNFFIEKKDIDILKKATSSVEKILYEKGIFSIFKKYYLETKIKNLLKIKDFCINRDIEELKKELNILKYDIDLREIERRINGLGNFQALTRELDKLKRSQKDVAINILKRNRRDALKGLLRDSVKSRRLKVHAKAIVEVKKNLQSRLLEQEDFTPLLETFPCWCTTTYAISSTLPLKPGLFDVAIIDEASQCDIASCMPILFRAKKAVIVGDDKQLPHLSFLEKTKEQSFLSKYEIEDKYQLMWRFRENSMFDLANYYCNDSILLDEHFRSLPEIIGFSNKNFYGSRMRLMRNDIKKSDILKLNIVENGKIDSDATRNIPEVEACVKCLYDILLNEKEQQGLPKTIGLISPFRAQVDALQKAVWQVIPQELIDRHKIEIGTAHTFQGDERDIIIISWCLAPNSFNQSLTFLQKPNLFNVALTRAKDQLINFISKNPKDLPIGGLLRDYFDYIENYKNKQQAIKLNNELNLNIYRNNFVSQVANSLIEFDYKIIPNFLIANFVCDFLAINEQSGKKLIVECDGFTYDSDNYDSKQFLNHKYTKMKRRSIIKRSGINILNISYRNWLKSPQACLDLITESL